MKKMGKKILSYGLRAIVLLSVLAMAVQATAQIPMADSFGVEDKTGAPNTNVEVPVDITNTDYEIAGIQFTILYDSSVINLIDIEYGYLTSTGWGKAFGGAAGQNVIVLDTDPTGANIIDIGESGSVVLLNFSVKNVPGASSRMNMSDIKLADTSIIPQKGTAPAKNGTFTLTGAGETPVPPSGGGDSGNGGILPTPPAGTQPYIDLNANPADIPADGTSTSTLTVSVWDGEEWVLENHTINFSTSLGSITASAPIENGTAIAVLTAGLEEGAAAITAEANLGGDVGTVTNTTTVNFVTPDVTPPLQVVTLTPTATVTPSPSPEEGIPGFEAGFAIAGLLAVAYVVLRRERKV